jgi:HEAT repeat protein
MMRRLTATIVLASLAAGCAPAVDPLPPNPLPTVLVRHIAAQAAAGDPAALPTIVPYLADRDPVVRTAACFAIEDLTGRPLKELGPKSAAYRVAGPPSLWREAVEELTGSFGGPRAPDAGSVPAGGASG